MINKMTKEIDDLRHSIRHIMKSIKTLGDSINAVDGKMDIIFEKLKMEDESKERRGKDKFDNCMYSQDGYCVEQSHIVDPETANVNTVRKGDLYYPQVTWVECEICDRCVFSP